MKTLLPLPKEDLVRVMSGAEPLWEKLRGKSILVTGATGFFGTWLLESFAYVNATLNLRASLTGLSRNPEVFLSRSQHIGRNPAINFLTGDLGSFKFPKQKFSYVIHAGAPVVAPASKLETIDTIIHGTRRVLDFAVHAGVSSFLLVSSGAVYGFQPSGMDSISENYLGGPDCREPACAYGEGKRVAELIGSIYEKDYGLQVKTARCFAFVGPHLPLTANFAIGNFIHAVLSGIPICIHGDGTTVRSYLYASDLMVALWTLLLKELPSRTYNVGSKYPVTISELAQLVDSVAGRIPRTMVQGQPVTLVGAGRRYVPDLSLSDCHYGNIETVSLEMAIRKTIDWWRLHERL